MTAPIARDPLFRSIKADPLTSRHLAALISGRVAAVRVPGTLDAAQCSSVLQTLERLQFSTYDPHRVQPVVARFGPGINDYRKSAEIQAGYWDDAAQAREQWARQRFEVDPFDVCHDLLAKAWPGEVAPGRRDGQDMLGGIIREINNGLQVHFDDVAREMPDNLLDVDLVAQLTLNLYLQVPPRGGETVVWRRRWSPGDEEWRIADGYGYSQQVVGGVESLTLRPIQGEVMIFDPRNYHTVRSAEGDRRVSFGVFLGLSTRGDLHLWA